MAGAVALARAEMPQKNALCGAFVGLVALRANGFDATDQDEVALAAGSVLPLDAEPSWPETETGRDDYRLPLPGTRDGASGTTAGGVARAIEQLSSGRLVVVPASGEWDAPALSGILGGTRGLGDVTVIANVDTAEFVAQDTADAELARYLEAGVLPQRRSSWRMPHFVVLDELMPGTAATLISVVDTYPSLGDLGVHLQPIENMAAALNRPRLSPGGLLLVAPAALQDPLRQLVAEAGMRTRVWEC